jgi:uncharacterized protein
MPKKRKIKIAFDTNIWVSFTIGKQLAILKSVLLNKDFKVFFCTEIQEEYLNVVSRDELKKYVSPLRIEETMVLIETQTHQISIKSSVQLSRDANDDFLLAFAKDAKLDYLITGDKDLLVLKTFENTEIVTMSAFSANFNLTPALS